nr:ABC transporter B family member 9-like [Coffea arabica]
MNGLHEVNASKDKRTSQDEWVPQDGRAPRDEWAPRDEPVLKIYQPALIPTVVFVGESGNGKSTLISLVERLYDVKSGCISLDAIDIRNYNLKWLRQQIALVSQEPILFKDTIRRNITYSKQEDTTEDEIVAAAKLANAHNFISALPQGYNTHVGECGAQLSGGQKQRIAIARAIVKDPKILLLDEATSSLDAESEKAVQAALNQVMVSKTAIVVTHRLTAIRGSDTIAFLRNGVIVEKGRHDELKKIANGAYASLFSHHLNHSI